MGWRSGGLRAISSAVGGNARLRPVKSNIACRPAILRRSASGRASHAAAAEANLARLNELLDSQQRAFNSAQVGRVLPVLFEKPGRHPGDVVGRSPYLQAVHIRGASDLIGRIAPVRIESAAKMSLAGEPAWAPA